MRSLVWVLNVVCIVCVILAFRTREKYRNALRKGRVSERAALKTVMSPGSMAALLGSAVEICIHLISPIPGFDETYIWHDEYSGQTMDGSLSMVITWFMCVRCYQVFRLYGVLGKVDDVRWAEILHYNGSSGILWAGVKKVLYDTHSWVLLAILYFCVVIAGGLTMTVAERHQAGCTAEICSKWHGLWLGYVTTSTIGYGDLFPTTVMGRVNAVAMAFTGIITVSLAKVILEKFINDLPIVERQVLVKDQLRTLASRTRDAGGLPHPPPQTAHHSGHRFSLVSIQDRDNVKIRALDNAVISAYAEVSDGHRRMLKFATQASLHLENVFWLSENTRRNSSRLSEFHRRKHLQEAPPSHAASSRKIRSLVAARRHSALVTRLQETLQILDDEVQRADTGETLGAFMRSRSEISRSQTSEDRKPLSTPKHERKKPKGSLKVGKRVEKDRGKESSPVELQRSVLGAALAETPDGVDSLSGDGSQDGDGFEEATLGWNRDGRPSGGGPDSPNSRGRRGGPRATQDPPLHLLGSSAQPERTVAFES
uniref:Potassium channel domain-containing protein n=1 Tax=Chromera velia CCMP2878 TaxID=1169474 RepID=A0A0G4HTJ3_9ALVE|eukprot:Cvel_8489.t1-p1 / transcript=Cvel_8489.t1 / gene=Cvel_8489 / organism=Chromera_velia_CCMP2878 / gene_product=pH-gated potassium channel KcsA, putative / transcript_product=pH-gated potassium channel KcsA, putative / location=Cvel_scaffold469:39755-45242(+) / protein_length=539 / sequence_SO=supercontig / SO=protein_coding / is_pseudo=false